MNARAARQALEAALTPACPAALIGRKIAAAEARAEELTGVDDPREARHLLAYSDMLSAQLEWTTASSWAGIYCQVLQMRRAAQAIAEGEETPCSALDRVDRLQTRVLDALEALGGVDADQFGRGLFTLQPPALGGVRSI